MKVLISFCNKKPDHKFRSNLMFLDLDTGKRKHLFESDENKGFTGISQDEEYFYALSNDVLAEIIIIDKKSHKMILKQGLKELHDPHSILLEDDELHIVSSGTDEVLRYKYNKEENRVEFIEVVWKTEDEGKRDSEHLNSIARKDGDVFISAFGKKENQDDNRSAKNGYVLNISTGEKIFKGIYHPHSLFIRDDYYYCESVTRIVKKGNKDILELEDGYLRGLIVKDEVIVCGKSRRRKNTKNGVLEYEKFCKVCVFDREKKELIKEFDFYPKHHEIYDIVEVF